MSDIIRISEQGKRQLIGLKRTTKIDQWNILCRWALCISLKEPKPLEATTLGPMSNIEMSLDVFLGRYKPVFFALLEQRRQKTDRYGGAETNHSAHINHTHRGISIMAFRKFTTPTIIDIAVSPPTTNTVETK